MTVRIAVVSHVARQEAARDLAAAVGADHISVDDGTLGCRANHLAAWGWHVAHPADWHVVLEDDAVPVEGFRDQLDAALAVAPANIVSLYLGGGYADDAWTSAAVDRAVRTGAHWLVTHGRVLSAVALAVRTPLVELMALELTHMYKSQAVDRALGLWARSNAHEVAYAVPSLVDHADGPSLVLPHRRRAPRRAFRVGEHEQWSNKTILMV